MHKELPWSHQKRWVHLEKIFASSEGSQRRKRNTRFLRVENLTLCPVEVGKEGMEQAGRQLVMLPRCLQFSGEKLII